MPIGTPIDITHRTTCRECDRPAVLLTGWTNAGEMYSSGWLHHPEAGQHGPVVVDHPVVPH